jgi:Transcription factor WhiB
VSSDWARDAACATADPHLFDGDTPTHTQQALTYCHHCPVTTQCAALATTPGQPGHRPTGVYAGHLYDDGKPTTRHPRTTTPTRRTQ